MLHQREALDSEARMLSGTGASDLNDRYAPINARLEPLEARKRRLEEAKARLKPLSSKERAAGSPGRGTGVTLSSRRSDSMIQSLRIREPRLGSAACEFGAVARSAIMAMTLTLISACHPPGDDARSASGASTPANWSGSTFSSQITGYNHTDKTIASFNVNGVWGGNVTPHANGGDTCCLQLPQAWRQDLHVKIDWEDDQGQQHSRDVLVPRYDPNSIGIFNVHFLRSGEIKPGIPNLQYPSSQFRVSVRSSGKHCEHHLYRPTGSPRWNAQVVVTGGVSASNAGDGATRSARVRLRGPGRWHSRCSLVLPDGRRCGQRDWAAGAGRSSQPSHRPGGRGRLVYFRGTAIRSDFREIAASAQ